MGALHAATPTPRLMDQVSALCRRGPPALNIRSAERQLSGDATDSPTGCCWPITALAGSMSPRQAAVDRGRPIRAV